MREKERERESKRERKKEREKRELISHYLLVVFFLEFQLAVDLCRGEEHLGEQAALVIKTGLKSGQLTYRCVA